MKNIVFISNYPPRGSVHGSHFGGVASYTKNTIKSITKAFNQDNKEVNFIVLADRFNGYKNYKEANVEVNRCWSRNDWFLLDKLLLQVLKIRNSKDVFIAFEFSIFGLNKFVTFSIPFFILFLRLFGKRVFLVSHHVLTDINKVDGQLGIKENSVSSNLYSLILRLFYKLIVAFSNKVVVFEEYLSQELIELGVNKNNLITINHGVEQVKSKLSKAKARKKLGISEKDFIVLNFGFIAWYKGSDWVVETFKSLIDKKMVKNNVRLIMAGGFSRNHKDNPVYNKMYEKIEDTADSYYDRIELTGFVPEDKINLYFEACDVVVLPYRVMLSASGPLSLALSYKKPFVLSDNLSGYIKNKDFKKSLKDSNLTKSDLFFALNEKSFLKKIDLRKETLLKLTNFSTNLANVRSWDSIGRQYGKLIA